MSLPFDPGYRNFVLFVENTLGLAIPTTKTARYRTLILEASHLKKKVETNPELYTWENLALTVEWLRRRREHIKSAAGVCFRVEAALKDSGNTHQPAPVVDVAVEIQRAIAWEQQNQMPGYQAWIALLTRSAGAGRQEVYNEWEWARQI